MQKFFFVKGLRLQATVKKHVKNVQSPLKISISKKKRDEHETYYLLEELTVSLY